MLRNLLLTLSYNGKNYHGWQIQKNATSVQAVFQNALFKVFDEDIDIKGCSRTDAGVHANVYCVSFKTEKNISVEKVPLALNKFLPNDICVTSCQVVEKDFHARYSCIGKEYQYKIWNAPIRNPFLDGLAFHYWYHLDIKELNAACEQFLGTHDFSAFCTKDTREAKNLVRTIRNFNVQKDGPLVTFTIEADGFLYNMVRIIIGTLLHVS
ncbi:MAG: tRNA pseudouridine(38-40) synthase TruA, partial [Clostridia bacterium]|nr:tRNA pseudouridine(38-40) synthase TruA [Clostridia bacterium]